MDGQDSGEELSDFNPVNDELEESAIYLPVYKSLVKGKMVLDEGRKTRVYEVYVVCESRENDFKEWSFDNERIWNRE